MGFLLSKGRLLLEGKRAWIVISIACVCFAILGVLVRYSVLQHLDLEFSEELQERTGTPLDSLMRAATFLGNTSTVIPLAVIVAIGLSRKRLFHAAAVVGMSLLSLPLVVILKEIWARARPDERLVHVLVERAGYSFPSGHAVIGTAFYGVLATLTWIHLLDHPARKPATFALAVLPPVIAISRVYLGAHWMSDVVAGTAVGLALLIPMAKWYSKQAKRDAETAILE